MGETSLSGLVDAHVHLDLLADAHEAIGAAKRAGVEVVLGVSMGLGSMQRTLELAREFPGFVLPALGLHPWQIETEDVSRVLERIEATVGSAVAIGEIGLDYGIKARKQLQKEVLRRQLGIAAVRDLPVILHCRYSHSATLEIVREMNIRRAVFHWYSGPPEILESLLQQGYFISATPALEYSQRHQEAIRATPMERILLETDSPVRYQDRESSPSDVVRVCELVARLKGTEVTEVARETTSNFSCFLGREK